MANKKVGRLKGGDLEELKARAKIMAQHNLIIQALDLQRKVWMNGKFKELGLDLNKDYEVDFKNGDIREQNGPTGNQTNSK